MNDQLIEIEKKITNETQANPYYNSYIEEMDRKFGRIELREPEVKGINESYVYAPYVPLMKPVVLLHLVLKTCIKTCLKKN